LHYGFSPDVSSIKTPYESEDAAMKTLEPLRTVHEQVEGTIIAIAATGTSSKDSLLSWIRFLQRSNPALNRIPVIFSMTSPFGQVVPVDEDGNTQSKEIKGKA
jgi:evolutionarily conserved signaling intermediate in Toll pathway